MRIGMGPENRRGTTGFDRSFDCGLDCLAFCWSRNNGKESGSFHDRGNRKRKRVVRHILDRVESPIIYLLRAAYFVQFDRFHHLWVIEIAERWVDKSEVTILTYSENRKLWGIFCKRCRIPFTFSGCIVSVAPQSIKLPEWNFAHQAVNEEAAKRLRRMLIHAQVFVQMVSDYPRPIDTGRCRERSQKLVL